MTVHQPLTPDAVWVVVDGHGSASLTFDGDERCVAEQVAASYDTDHTGDAPHRAVRFVSEEALAIARAEGRTKGIQAAVAALEGRRDVAWGLAEVAERKGAAEAEMLETAAITLDEITRLVRARLPSEPGVPVPVTAQRRNAIPCMCAAVAADHANYCPMHRKPGAGGGA